MNEQNKTEQHITQTALRLFLEQGIKKTSVDEIASAAGLTRVTVYRYFTQRVQIVQAVFRHVIAPIQKARERVEADSEADIEDVLDTVAYELARLPQGDLPMCLDELQRLYPALYKEFSEARQEALSVIFDRLFEIAQRKQRLRPGLNRVVVKAYFMEAVIKVLVSPTLLAHGLPPAELYTTIKTIFLYGILKD